MKTLKLSALFISLLLTFSCGNAGNSENPTVSKTVPDMPANMTKADFINKVFDYEQKQDWAYKGDMPCVIDFYADWCRPCKLVAPIMDELAQKYAGKVRFYKINTDKEKDLAMAFNIQSIPSVLFIPMNGQPMMSVGASSKEDFIKSIETILNRN